MTLEVIVTRLNWDREARQARVRKNGAMGVFSDSIARDWSGGKPGRSDDVAQVKRTCGSRFGPQTVKGGVTAAPSLSVQAIRASFELQRLLRLTGHAPWERAGSSAVRVTVAEVQQLMDKLGAVDRAGRYEALRARARRWIAMQAAGVS